MKTLVVEQTDYLEVEYVRLPMVDLSIRFLWRVCKPLTTTWKLGFISWYPTAEEAQDLGYTFDENPFDFEKRRMQKYFEKEWLGMFSATEGSYDEILGIAPWLLHLTKVNLVECEIRRKN